MMKRMIILAMLALGGCAAGLYARYPVTKSVSPADALIRFKDASFQNAKVARVHHLDAFEHIEYAWFETDDMTLEAVYDTALGEGLVLQYDYWMERMVDTWNAHRGQDKIWKPKTSVWAWHGELDYQPFRLARSGRECVGFNSEWDYEPRDSFGRPTKVFFGYVCAKPGAKLSEKRVAALLAGASISERPGESFVAPGTRRQVDQLAFNTARGVAGSVTGNAEFPFNFGTTLEESENGREFEERENGSDKRD
jgi:hypothetical protein